MILQEILKYELIQVKKITLIKVWSMLCEAYCYRCHNKDERYRRNCGNRHTQNDNRNPLVHALQGLMMYNYDIVCLQSGRARIKT